MIRITNVDFINFRQYKSVNISFQKGRDNDLHVLCAQNGTGKTTFLNGILWCLYGVEHYLTDKDKALPVVNSTVFNNAKENDELKVSVRLTLNNADDIIVFDRSQLFYVKYEPLKQKKIASPGPSKLKVITTSIGSTTNSKVIEDEAAVLGMVKQYFDEAIFDFYFFDGESLEEYFEAGKSEKIKSSIFNISQLTLLKNASAHARNLENKKYRSASMIYDKSSEALMDEIQQTEATIEALKKENESLEAEKPRWQRIVDTNTTALQGYSPIRLNMHRRKELEEQLEGLKKDYLDFIGEKNLFITSYLTLLNFYPRAKHVLEIIREKQETGTLPPSIDKEQIQALLSEHAKTCPVCNGILDQRAIAHMQSLLDQLDVSSATSNFLMEIKGGLEQVVNKCKEFPTAYEKLQKDNKYYVEELAKVKSELDAISAFLTRYSDENGSIDVKKLEEERKQANDRIAAIERRVKLNSDDIEANQTILRSKIAAKELVESRLSKKNRLTKEVAVYLHMRERFDQIQAEIMDEIRKEIQRLTRERFHSMIWKQHTFGDIDIDGNYEMTVYNLDHHEMTGSLSATEYMALAYAFTLAIHDASGKNCPLVVDSPLGRVSDENRANMARELYEVSKNKQIIMLFTPDEYSSEVREVYDGRIASIRNIQLSESEDQVEGVNDQK